MPSVQWKLARAASRAAASSRKAAAAAAAAAGDHSRGGVNHHPSRYNPVRDPSSPGKPSSNLYGFHRTIARWNIPLSVRVSQIDSMDLPVITAPPSTNPSRFFNEEAYLPIQEAYRFFSTKRRGPGSIPSSGCNIVFFSDNAKSFRFI